MAVHAVAVPVDVDAAELAARVRARVGARLWVDDVPAGEFDRRRSAELARPTDDVRCVLVRSGERASLVVAARRDLPVLALAAALLDPSAELRWEGRAVAAPAADPPPWGLGTGSGVASVALPVAGGDETRWRAALADVLAWYGGTPAVGLFVETTRLAGAEYVPGPPVHPLTLTVFPEGDGWVLRCDHLTGHFAPDVAERFARHVAAAYDAGVAPSPAVVAELVELGRSPVALDSTPTTISEAFRRVVTRSPEAIAVCDRDVRLTYARLDALSDAVADGLRERGVGPGDRVVVCLERTSELVVVLLGVLKAGACYVPTDPAYPADRLAYTARDAAAALVVTRLAGFPADDVVAPDDLAAPPGSTGAPAGRPPWDADSPAYVIYTSGSTGRPKGVVVPHRNVIALVDATRDEYGLDADQVWTLFHSSAFDFSVWEAWGCLLTGGRLVVVSYEDSRDPERFRDLLAGEAVTVLSQTPSAFAQLLDVDHAALAVRLVVLGGEPLDARVLLRWHDRHPDCRVVNMFGITETTVHVTAQTYDRGLALAASRSVGRPLPGWHVYVMDEGGRPTPPGVPGEIWVGGAGVALGYLNRPELTGQRFVPDPYAGGTAYRSGDLGRLLPDGTLHHLGRIDGQVKIRGFRVELDEIRAVLLESPDVRAAAVVVRDPGTARARLDAYVVPAGLDTRDLHTRARDILPDHMVPATVTALDALPLTANGKLDASRLPEPDPRAEPAAAPPPPGEGSTDEGLAEAMREAWSAAFGMPVGLDDDFYHLGGNSLLAVRISAALKSRGLPSPSLRELFRTPTIRELTTR
ncbi:non-ribosomal peptide synthetase [Actinosynnema sp. NPDC059335]|uniref:non-ribosomal peptide synthetase n=1 Tax=Actinosynnema sp. NPDC059335 TaxID=3346804 RepID=UPI00366B7241